MQERHPQPRVALGLWAWTSACLFMDGGDVYKGCIRMFYLIFRPRSQGRVLRGGLVPCAHKWSCWLGRGEGGVAWP